MAGNGLITNAIISIKMERWQRIHWIDGSYVDASGVWIKDKKQEPENGTKTGWVQYSGHWMYYNTDGSYLKSNWKSVNSIWYYFDQNGWMVTGWMPLSSGKYYLNPTKNSDGVEGAMLKGYKQIDGKWYYLRSGESPGRLTEI